MSVWRVYLISLCSFDRDWDGGVFDTEESAQVALHHERAFRVREPHRRGLHLRPRTAGTPKSTLRSTERVYLTSGIARGCTKPSAGRAFYTNGCTGIRSFSLLAKLRA